MNYNQITGKYNTHGNSYSTPDWEDRSFGIDEIFREETDPFDYPPESEDEKALRTKAKEKMASLFGKVYEVIKDLLSILKDTLTNEFVKVYDIIQRFLTTVYLVTKAKNKQEIALFVAWQLSPYVVSKLAKTYSYLRKTKFSTTTLKGFVKGYQVQSLNPEDMVRGVLDSALAAQMFDIARDAIYLELVPEEFRTKITPWIGKSTTFRSESVGYLHFSYKLINTSLEICKSIRGYINDEINVIEIFSSPRDVFLCRSFSIINDRDFYKISPGAREHRDTLHNSYSEVKKLLKLYTSLNSADKRTRSVMTNHAILKRMADDYSERIRSLHRQVPFGIIVYGDPGIGKSSIMVGIHKIYCEHSRREYSENLIYERDVLQEYWSNYDPAEHPIIHFPEVGATHKNIASKKGDSVLNELLNVQNDTPFQANMAAVEDKGKYMVTPEFLTIDTNNPDLNAKETMNNPSAVYRRFLYVHASVKPEFQADGATSLDMEKVPEHQNLMDLWDFKIYRRQPSGNRKYLEISVHPSETVVNMAGLRYHLLAQLRVADSKHNRFRQATSMSPSDYGHYNPKFKTQAAGKPEVVHLKETPDVHLEATKLLEREKRKKFLKETTTTVKIRLAWFIQSVIIMFTALCSFVWSATNLAWYNIKCNIVMKGHRYVASSTWKRYGPSGSYVKGVATVCIVLAGFKMALYGYEASRFKSQSAKVSKRISEINNLVDAGFSKAKKKSDTCVDYSIINTFTDRPRFSARAYNKTSEVYTTMLKNIRYVALVKISEDGKELARIKGVCFGVKGNYALINKHTLGLIDRIDQIHVSNSKKIRDGFRMIDFKNVKTKLLRDDVTLLTLDGVYFSDVLSLFPRNLDQLRNVCIRMYPNGKVANFNTVSMTADGVAKIVLDNSIAHYQEKPKAGDCGLPRMAVINTANVILGIHAAGITERDKAICVPVSQLSIEQAIDQLEGSILSQGHVPLPNGMSLTDVNKHSPLLYEDIDTFCVYGDIAGNSRSKPISTLKKFPWHSEIEAFTGVSTKDEEGRPKFGIPKMKPSMVGGEYISPLNNWLRKVNHKKPCLDKKILADIENVILTRLFTLIPDDGLKPLMFDEALNGAPENFYIRSMNFSTSAGVMWPGKKNKYVWQDPKTKKYYALSYLVDQVKDIFECYQRGEFSHRLLGAQLKDEILPHSKVLNGKTRIFFSAPFDFVLMQRMILGPFYSLMIEYRTAFCCRLGTNMMSKEAHDIYMQMTEEGWLIFEGDYSGYDVSFPLEIAISGNNIVYEFLKRRGYSEQSLYFVKAVLEENLFPTVNFNNTVMVMPGIQPSGKYGTAEDNSLKGLILLMYAWYFMMCDEESEHYLRKDKKPFTLQEFFNFVRPNIYGDDILAAVHKAAQEFNALSYANFCKNVYGSKFTASSKGDVTQKFVEASEMSFLKRNFRYHPLLKRYVAALDPDSLVKMVGWRIPSRYAEERAQAVETLASYLREKFFHLNTEADYEEQRKLVIELVVKHYHDDDGRLDAYLPTYSDMMELAEPEYKTQAIGMILRGAMKLPKIVRKVRKVKPLKRGIKVVKKTRGIFGKVKGLLKGTKARAAPTRKGRVPGKKSGIGSRIKDMAKEAATGIKDNIKSAGAESMMNFKENIGAHVQERFGEQIRAAKYAVNKGPGMSSGRRLTNTYLGGSNYKTQSAQVNMTTEEENGQEIVIQDFSENAEHVEGETATTPEYVVGSSYTIEQMLSQYVYCGRITNGLFNEFNPFVMWATNPVINDLLIKHAGFRCNLELSITWDATKQSSGYYVLASYPIAHTNVFFRKVPKSVENAKAYRMYISQNEYSATIQLEKQSHLNYMIPFIYEKPFVPLDTHVNSLMTSLEELSTVYMCGWGVQVPVDMEFEIKVRALDLELDVRTEYRTQSEEPQINHINPEEPNEDGSVDSWEENGLEEGMEEFEEICSRPSIIAEIDYNGNRNENLGFIPVTPSFGLSFVTTRNLMVLPPAGWISMAFRQWRGTMCYRVQIVASQYSQGKIAIRYSPSPQRYDSHEHPLQGLGARREYILDLASERELDITIGMSNREYYNTGLPANEEAKTMGNFSDENFRRKQEIWHDMELCNGFISFSTIGAIHGLDTDQDLKIVVLGWMEDCEFFVPNTGVADEIEVYDPLEDDDYRTQSNPVVYQTQSEEPETSSIVFRSRKEPISGCPNYGQIVYDNIYTLTGTLQQKISVSTGKANDDQILVFTRDIPSLKHGTTLELNKGLILFTYTFYDHFKHMFCFKRGGMRYMVSYPNQSSNVLVASSYGHSLETAVAAWADDYPSGATVYNINLTTGPYEFSSMSMAGTMFEPVCKPRDRTLKYANQTQYVHLGVPRISTSRMVVKVFQATGHSFRFIFFQGCPLFRQKTGHDMRGRYKEAVSSILTSSKSTIKSTVSSFIAERMQRSSRPQNPLSTERLVDFSVGLQNLFQVNHANRTMPVGPVPSLVTINPRKKVTITEPPKPDTTELDVLEAEEITPPKDNPENLPPLGTMDYTRHVRQLQKNMTVGQKLSWFLKEILRISNNTNYSSTMLANAKIGAEALWTQHQATMWAMMSKFTDALFKREYETRKQGSKEVFTLVGTPHFMAYIIWSAWMRSQVSNLDAMDFYTFAIMNAQKSREYKTFSQKDDSPRASILFKLNDVILIRNTRLPHVPTQRARSRMRVKKKIPDLSFIDKKVFTYQTESYAVAA